MERQKIKKIGKIAMDTVLYLFIALCLLAVTLVITSKRDSDGTATVFGKQMRFVQSPSMEKCELTDVSAFEIGAIPVRSVVFIETVPKDKAKADAWYADLKVGDVLTFKYVYVRQETITHRITAIEQKETGGYIISLAGDNKSSEDGALTQVIDTSLENSPNYVVGRVTGQCYPLGLLIHVLQKPVGIVCIVILPSLVILALEVVKIVRVLGAERKEKYKKEAEQRQGELDELRRRLAELEGERADRSEENENSGDES